MKDDHRSYINTQLLQLGKESLKKFRLVRDSNPWPLRYWCSALPIKLHRYRRGQGNESRTSRNFFFQAFFSQLQRLRICVHIIWFSYIQNFNKKLSYTLLLVLIFNNYWTRLSKIVICLWRADQLFAEAEARLRQIIDLRDTDKSRYFAITEFNNCFIIRSPSLFF